MHPTKRSPKAGVYSSPSYFALSVAIALCVVSVALSLDFNYKCLN
jgi:hypothetical protein